MDGLRFLEALTDDEAQAAFRRCCGAVRWAKAMTAGRPYRSNAELLAAADRQLATLAGADWLEAFGHHPRIGDKGALRARFASTRGWAEKEQAGAAAAGDAVLEALSRRNAEYEARFGYIFIVCATGKSAGEMLGLLEARLGNDPERELQVAAGEQAKITRLRLEKLLEEVP